MVGSHKILTVSYGTFSCTLEGFEDSFGTMKAIAEYFRDLAADDRYFGAEPPTPDAEMLARIAEREIARRVEARLDSSGIVLRVGQALDEVAARETPAEAAPETPDEAASVEPMAPRVQPQRVVAIEEAAPAAPRPMPAMQQPPAHPDSDSIAAKLERIRAVVGRQPARIDAGDAEDNAPAPVIVAPTLVEADLAEPPALKIEEAVAPEAEVEPEMVAPPEAEAEPEILAPVAAAPEAEPELVAPAAPEVVAEAEMAAPVAEAPVAEPEPAVAEPPAAAAPAAPPVRARVIRMRRADFDKALESGAVLTAAPLVEGADDLPQAAEPPAPAASALSAEAEAALLAELAELETDGVDPVEAFGGDDADSDDIDLDADVSAPETDEAILAAVGADTVEADAAEEEAILSAIDSEMAEDEADFDAASLAEALGDVEEAVADEAADFDPAAFAQSLGDAEEPVAEDAGVADFDAAAFAESLGDVEVPVAVEETAEFDEVAEAETATDDLTEEVSAEAVAQDTDEPAADILSRIVASVGPETAEPRAEDAADDAHAHLRGEPDADAAAMDRLLQRTEAGMADPAAKGRREALASLKAAVAATEAARRLGEFEEDGEEVENAFRDDLRQVVRPRRPVMPGAHNAAATERPRPAPLKLVAAQRVDLPQVRETPVVPVRPRRVTSAAEPVQPAPLATTNFADFAAEMGAKNLGDLLEAAAAYTAFVEGVEDFSRPQVMKKVTQLDPDAWSREDTLRSFGTLLRDGRITQTGMGRFQVAADTRFNPQRRAG